MKFSFMKKFEELEKVELVAGDIVEYFRGAYAGTVCLVTDKFIVSLQDSDDVWDNVEIIVEDLRKVPKGSVVTLTQE